MTVDRTDERMSDVRRAAGMKGGVESPLVDPHFADAIPDVAVVGNRHEPWT